MTTPHPYLTEATQLVAQARTIHDTFAGQAMPKDAAAVIDSLLVKAADLRSKHDQWLAEPQYKHDMTNGSVPAGGLSIDGTPAAGSLSKDAPRLGLETKLLDHLGFGRVNEEAIYGALGHMVKASVFPTSPDETARWAKYIGAKDMGTGTLGAGGALVPTAIAALVIDLMRAQTVVLAAGGQVVPMSAKVVNVPRLAGDVTSAWLAEAAVATASDATLEQVTLTAKRNEVGPVKISHELDEDSDPVSIGAIVARSIAHAAALKLDQAALRGSGVDPEPKGVRNQTGVTLYAPGANGDALTWDVLLQLSRNVCGANAVPNAFVMTPGAAITLASLKEATTNAYLQPPDLIKNFPRYTTTSIPSNITKGTGTALTEVYHGDFKQLLIGLRTALSLQTLHELYRVTGQVGIIARFRADVGVEHGPAFSVATHVDD